MSRAVLDASAVLAVLFGEPGADVVLGTLSDAVIGTVNLAEVVTTLCERGHTVEKAVAALGIFSLEIKPFSKDDAVRTASLRQVTRRYGLSLGDRACLALAAAQGAVAVTADRAWKGEVEKATSVTVLLIRGAPHA